MTDATTTPLTVRFGRLPRLGLLLRLSSSRVLCLCVAALVFVPAIFLGSTTGAGLTAPLWGGLIALAFVRWHGRPAVESLPTAGHYAVRNLNGQTKFRARPSAPRPGGTLALPGDAAALRFLVDEESGAAICTTHTRTRSLRSLSWPTRHTCSCRATNSQGAYTAGVGRWPAW